MIAKQKMRKAKAQNDISALAMAIQTYATNFGVPPPDSNASLDTGFDDMDTPNECLAWFLTREYRRSQTPTELHSTGADGVEVVSARIMLTPCFSIDSKQKKDYDNDGFYEFVDPWGKPYLYRAYRKRQIDRITRPGGNTSRVYLKGHVAPGEGSEIQIAGTAANNGTHTVTAAGVDSGQSYLEIDFAAGAAESPSAAYITMEKLHNPDKGYDLYSVGPNYKTNAAAVQYMPPYGPAETAAVWGYLAAGNDLNAERNGNVLENDKDRDDVCNW